MRPERRTMLKAACAILLVLAATRVFGPAMAASAATPAPIKPASSKPAAASLGGDREAAVAALFERLRDDPVRLRVLLRQMPKGGDLHNHLDGSPYAEDYLAWAAQRGLCVDPQRLAIADGPCGPDRPSAQALATDDPALYGRLVDAMSVRGWLQGVGRDTQSGHDRMFGAFDRFLAIATRAPDASIVWLRRTAWRDRLIYLELIYNPVEINRFALARRDPQWRDDAFEAAYARVAPDLPALVVAARAGMDATQARADASLGCGTASADPACAVAVRYMGYGLRELPMPQLFGQLAALFALAAADPRFVAVNLVQPEDAPASLRNYAQTMRMVAWFAARYPDVHRTWHAGELTLGMVPPAALADHIAQAIGTGRAQRIGHGTDIGYETDAAATLAAMARDHVDVEINLTSNDVILGVRGADHPLRLYLAAGVPVTLSTDDEGVLRTDMTEQYLIAARDHGLGYLDLKRIARASLDYAFLPGASLWRGHRIGEAVPACAAPASAACAQWSQGSDKATLQRRLEAQFAAFEAQVTQEQF